MKPYLRLCPAEQAWRARGHAGLVGAQPTPAGGEQGGGEFGLSLQEDVKDCANYSVFSLLDSLSIFMMTEGEVPSQSGKQLAVDG